LDSAEFKLSKSVANGLPYTSKVALFDSAEFKLSKSVATLARWCCMDSVVSTLGK